MRTPPPLPDHALPSALRAGYGLSAATVTFLPLGYDSNATVYRAQTTDGTDYFLKLRRGAVNAAGLAVPRWLHEQGLAEVIAPLRTLAGGLWHPFDQYALIVYPFIPDAVPLPSGQADNLWRQFGAAMRRVHAANAGPQFRTGVPPALTALLQRDSFTPVAVELVRTLDALVHTQSFDEPLSTALADTWRAHASQIVALIELAEAGGQQLRANPPAPLQLCHADPHWDNVLVDAHDRLWLVDWDDTLLSAPERDLMFVIGGISPDWGTPQDTALFMEGYGEGYGSTNVDPLALAYYRANWALQDIGAYADDVLRADVGEATRRDALRLFQRLFDPGSIVDKALNNPVPHV